jgi:TfoX/Sxy family transcriptional regulator of competence genes
MKMPKTTEADKQLFDRLLPEAPGVTRRPMFGQMAGFVNGNMFLCLFGDRIAVKLPDAQAEELLDVEGAGPFAPMEGRPMKGYVLLPRNWHDDPKKARPWIERSLAYVSSMPPKEAKASRAKR